MERIYRIHEAVGEGRYPNCSSLVEDLGVTAKTIQRDITFMRDRLSLPLAYDEQAHGYHYTPDVSTFPVFEIRAEEFDGVAYLENSFGVWTDPERPDLKQEVRIELSGYQHLHQNLWAAYHS